MGKLKLTALFEVNLTVGSRDTTFLKPSGPFGPRSSTVSSDGTLCQNGSVLIRCRTMHVGAALAQ